jgi:hypothetical protein
MDRVMKKLLSTLVLGLLLYGIIAGNPNLFQGVTEQGTSPQQLQTLYANRQSNVQVSGVGTVKAILKDDLDGSRHQKFIIELPTGQTLLIAHNIDLAPRIEGLRQGDRVEFFGEYEWNAKGGVVHWTHHDPQGLHENGWLKHQGRLYQ